MSDRHEKLRPGERLLRVVRISTPYSRFVRAALAALLVAVALVSALPVAARRAPADPTATAAATSSALQPYFVHLGQPGVLVQADAPPTDLTVRMHQKVRDDVAALLDQLKAQGQAGAASFDDAHDGFLVDLTSDAVRELSNSSSVGSVGPASATLATSPAKASSTPTPLPPPSLSSESITTQSISSVNFVQVYSPFMWGRVSVGGLSINLTLEDSSGITIGVPVQTYWTPPNNYVHIDRAQLYYETVFVDPNQTSHPPVIILPGDQVVAVTTGVDPTTGLQSTNTRTIVVDDVQAWTSYQNNSVTGHTSLANASIVVTVGGLSASSYLTPGSSMTYAELTADANGNFTASQFRTSTSSTYTTVKLQQGSTGFVRVIHRDGDEVFTVHGQNVLVLENSYLVHGYVFGLPGPTGGLVDSGVTVSRPAPLVSITLKDAAGNVKSGPTVIGGGTPYRTILGEMVSGGDVVEVSIYFNGTANLGPINRIATTRLTGKVDLAGMQVTGVGPATTPLMLGVGNIDGYISESSTFHYIQKQVSTDASGAYASGSIQCGTTALPLQPGSFGYVGYEDGHGNFVYEDFAAPTNHVMVNSPYVEGWVADGTVTPTVTVLGSNGAVKSQGTATASVLYSNLKLYFNLFYNFVPSQFIDPGDTVVVNSGGQTFTIPVVQLTGSVDEERNFVDGTAPAGATVKVIPSNNRTAFQTAVADANGNFTAVNPFSTFNYSSCTTSTTNLTFPLGQTIGRLYLSYPDGNAVFGYWGRGMIVNEDENFIEAFLFPSWNLDWPDTPGQNNQTGTVTLTHADGASVTLSETLSGGAGDTKIYLTDTQGQKVLIRGGDSLSVSYLEGLRTGPTRNTTMDFSNIPLVTGSPDLPSSTLAGVGPRSWAGHASLNPPPSASSVALASREYTAYGPLSFTSGSTKVSFVMGYSGGVSFSDSASHRVWAAWAVTAYPVKILGFLQPGDITVCGKATAGVGVKILDATTQPVAAQIGSGSADSNGNFCVPVSPPLYRGEVILAQDGYGTLSQPVIVGLQVYLPIVFR